VHGANRLASNSLLEGLVFARRIAEDLARDLPPQADPAPGHRGVSWAVEPSGRTDLQRAMSAGAGVLRSAGSLAGAAAELARLGAVRAAPHTASWEMTNLVTVASTLVAAAYARQETRGCHWREDFPEASPEWLGHIVGCIAADGVRRQQWEAL
jgi:L-aspartate oxidase